MCPRNRFPTKGRSMSVLLLKWQPTTDRYTVTLDAPDQALKRKATVKGKATGKRHATKKVSQNQKRPKKKETRGKSPKKPHASLPLKRHQQVWEGFGNACTADAIVMKPVCPSSSWSCRKGFKRVCSLSRFGFQYRTGYRYPLVYCVSAGNDTIQVSSCLRVQV